MLADLTGYFITWSTYGTWLPGDERGWILHEDGWQKPDPVRELESKARMKEDACLLEEAQRQAVNVQIEETCSHRGWTLHAVNFRTNHVHVVVFAPGAKPDKVTKDLKSWATRRLKEINPTRMNWWAERGSMRQLYGEEALLETIEYVLERQ